MAAAITHQQGMSDDPRRKTTDDRTVGLVIDGVALARGMRVIQPALSHSIAPGGMTLLTGPNGSGKSTLLRAIAGRLRPVAGRISCAVPRLYVGHADGLAAPLSGRRNLTDWAGLKGRPDDADAIDRALAALAAGPFSELPVRMLSRGQRRRLALARLALSPPGALWLLDEPAAGLDQAAQAALDRLITAHLDNGGMVMAATHTPLGAGCAPDELALESMP
jgi:heme exporter protein A